MTAPTPGDPTTLCTLDNADTGMFHLSPDCRDGKHTPCTHHHAAWCYIEDAPINCDCPCHPRTP